MFVILRTSWHRGSLYQGFMVLNIFLNNFLVLSPVFSFLAHGWRSHAMGFWRHSNGTRSLTHSLTHLILINLFIKVRLNTLLLPPLLSITFVPSAFYAFVLHILEGTSEAYIFSGRKRAVSSGWVLYKWQYSKQHWQYHLQEMDLELLKGRWNNWAWIIVVYLDKLCTFVPDITWNGEDAIDRSVKELSKPDDGISFSEKRISQRTLAAKKRSSNWDRKSVV